MKIDKIRPFKKDLDHCVYLQIQLVIVLMFMIGLISCNNNRNIQEEFYPDGTIKSEIAVKNGLKNGVTKMFDEKGRLTGTAEYVNDSREGWVINYNPANGKIVSKAFYKNDKQNGPVTLYYQEGQLYREMKYVDDRVDSIVKTYWPNGKLQAENLFRKGDPAVGLKEYDSDGNLIKEPEIVVKENNQLSFSGKLIVKASISDGTEKVEYFLDDLQDGKFLGTSSYRIKNENGVATIEYPLARGTSFKKKLSIIARLRTERGNTLVLQKTYNLAAAH